MHIYHNHKHDTHRIAIAIALRLLFNIELSLNKSLVNAAAGSPRRRLNTRHSPRLPLRRSRVRNAREGGGGGKGRRRACAAAVDGGQLQAAPGVAAADLLRAQTLRRVHARRARGVHRKVPGELELFYEVLRVALGLVVVLRRYRDSSSARQLPTHSHAFTEMLTAKKRPPPQ